MAISPDIGACEGGAGARLGGCPPLAVVGDSIAAGADLSSAGDAACPSWIGAATWGACDGCDGGGGPGGPFIFTVAGAGGGRTLPCPVAGMVGSSMTSSNSVIGVDDGRSPSPCWSFSSISLAYMPSSEARKSCPAAVAASAARRSQTIASCRSPRAQSALAVDSPQTTSSSSSGRGSGKETKGSVI